MVICRDKTTEQAAPCAKHCRSTGLFYRRSCVLCWLDADTYAMPKPWEPTSGASTLGVLHLRRSKPCSTAHAHGLRPSVWIRHLRLFLLAPLLGKFASQAVVLLRQLPLVLVRRPRHALGQCLAACRARRRAVRAVPLRAGGLGSR